MAIKSLQLDGNDTIADSDGGDTVTHTTKWW